MALMLSFLVFNPYSFLFQDEKDKGVFVIMAVAIVFVIPLVVVAVMKGIGLISSFRMMDKKERIGPLIAIMTCYIWFFINLYNNPVYPDELSILALGSCLAVGMGFFINNFSKISLHAIGAGGLVCGLYLSFSSFELTEFKVTFPLLGSFWISSLFVLILSVLIAGAIGTARLYLNAHRSRDVFGGYLVGIFAFLMANSFL